MTTPATPPDDLSLRTMLDTTLNDFGVQVAPAQAPAATPVPQVNISHQPFDRRTQAFIAIGALFIVLAGYLWVTQSTTTDATMPAITAPAPTSAPTSRPTATGVSVDALIGYFDYTNPTTAAALTSNQIKRVVGSAGTNWRLVNVGSAHVWIAANQVPKDVPVNDPLPDLTPRRLAAPVQIERPIVAPVSVPVSAPIATDPPPPPPTRCAEAGIPGKMVSVCGSDDLNVLQEQAKAQWLQQYGGNIGTVSTPSPQVRQP